GGGGGGAGGAKRLALDWGQAAGLMLAGVTAWHTLAATAVRPGDTVLIHGAAGGVGLMAVQLATGRGATAVATASPARHGFLRDLGAVPVADGPGLAGRGRAALPGGGDAPPGPVGPGEGGAGSVELGAARGRGA